MVKSQKGFAHVVLIIVIVLAILAAIALTGWRVLSTERNHQAGGSGSDGSSVTWRQTETGWSHTGKLPDCPSPLNLPIDISKATSTLYPGQYRGGEYKPHGGFRFDNETSNNVIITAPFDAQVVRGAHYSVAGDPSTFLILSPLAATCTAWGTCSRSAQS